MNNKINRITSIIKTLANDRYLFTLYLAMSILALVFSIQIITSVHASDLQLVSRYTAFGNTHFYRDQWFYLLIFPIFLVTLATAHIIVSNKTNDLVNRSLALMFAWFGLGLITFTWITANIVLTVWSPL